MSDTHWLRADVDAFLMREAVALGAEYADEVELDAVEWSAGGRPGADGAPPAARRSGSRPAAWWTPPDRAGFSAAPSRSSRARFDGYPGTQALFSHFTDVARCDEMPDYAGAGMPGDAPPYPVDDAALHHVFDGGWMWVLRFGNGVTSAGVAVVDALAEDLRLADGEPAWHRLLTRFPTVRAQFADARAHAPVRLDAATELSRRVGRGAALGAAAVGGRVRRSAVLDRIPADAARHRAAGVTARVGGVLRRPPASLEVYSATTLAEADHTARFVAGCYAGFPRFDDFVQYSMFYFAAASYAEMARRVAPERAAAGFLRAGDPAFASAMCALSPAVASSAAIGRTSAGRGGRREYCRIVRGGEAELVWRRRRRRHRRRAQTRSRAGDGRFGSRGAGPLTWGPLCRPGPPEGGPYFLHLVDRARAAADRGTDERALLAADEGADAGAGTARSADHHRALLPRPRRLVLRHDRGGPRRSRRLGA